LANRLSDIGAKQGKTPKIEYKPHVTLFDCLGRYVRQISGATARVMVGDGEATFELKGRRVHLVRLCHSTERLKVDRRGSQNSLVTTQLVGRRIELKRIDPRDRDIYRMSVLENLA